MPENIIFANGVIHTEYADQVIDRIDPYFGKAGLIGKVTDILRTPALQLAVMTNLAMARHLIPAGYALNLSDMAPLNGAEYPRWQIVWSELLNCGTLINPPLPARPLLDYIRDGINKKGVLIQPSEHFVGRAIDFSGQPDISRVNAVLVTAQAARVGITAITVEHGNNCLHCSISPA